MPAPMSRNPVKCFQEAMGAGRACKSAGVAGVRLGAGMFLLRGRCGALRFAGEFAEFGEGFFSPAQVGFELDLAEARGHLPVRRIGILAIFSDLFLDLLESIEERPL